MDGSWRLDFRRPPADSRVVNLHDLALAQGLRRTRATLGEWRADSWSIVPVWVGWSALIAAGLLTAVWLVARGVAPDASLLPDPGGEARGGAGEVGRVLALNALVLALHAMACVAGFIAGYAVPGAAELRSGWSRWVHEQAARLAIAFVACATLFSLATQALALGLGTSALAAQLGTTPGWLLLALLPHAAPELCALFLPLAAWVIAARRGAWHQLLAATMLTVAIAVPVLVGAALVEVYVTPPLVDALFAPRS